MRNNKGFTLVELIATIVVLAIVAGIGTISITSIIRKSKEENYNLLLKNINSAAESYYQECKYNKSDAIECIKYDENNGYVVSLGNLVTYGFLKGNAKDSNDEYTIVDPSDNDKSIVNCKISIEYSTEKIIVRPYSNTDINCPTSYVLDEEINKTGYKPTVQKPWLKK